MRGNKMGKRKEDEKDEEKVVEREKAKVCKAYESQDGKGEKKKEKRTCKK